jgi:DnaJ-class molecular chaperone
MKPLNYNKRTCPCCHGQGTQYNRNTGLRVLCPTCNGTGTINKEISEYRWQQ